MIPPEWKQFRLAELCKFQNGFAFKNSDYVEEGEGALEVFRMGNIRKGGGFNPDGNKALVSCEQAATLRRFLIHEGDILMCMTDMKANMALLGHTAWMPVSGRYLLNQRVGRITVERPDLIDGRFLYYYSNSPEYIDYLRSHANSGVQVNLSTDAILNSPIVCPPLTEQRLIAGILSAYDELIENNQRRIHILEAIPRALYREWFFHERPASPAIHLNFQMRYFGDLCDLIKQPFNDEVDAELPLLDLSRMPQRSLATSETGEAGELTTSRIVFQSGDTLFGAIRCYLHKVVAAHYRGITNTSVLVLRPKRPQFRSLVALIASDVETIRWAEGHSNGTKMPVISWSVFQRMPAPWPSEPLAQKFESIAGPILDQIGVLADQVRNLRRTRDLLLPRLLSGQITLANTAG
jgi:hypothetical protein